MTEAPGTARWTCPHCLWLCDDLIARPNAQGSGFEVVSGHCAAAPAALAQFGAGPSEAAAQIDGQPVSANEAVSAAARILAASRQPLFGGLGTDVAGARALYRLACATGAICDAAGGEALMHGVRALQDRGAFTTTLAEVRNRADVIVCVGGLPSEGAADFFERCGFGEGLVAQRHVVLLGGSDSDAAALAALATPATPATPSRLGSVSVEALPWHGDLFATVALLSALVAARAIADAPPSLRALAGRLRSARYAVIVGATGGLPVHGALVIEALNRLVGTLNLSTRAGAIWLGGGNGAGTVNQVFTWLSGLPLRTRAGPAGLEHEPVLFDAARLIADAAVDSLLWVSSFDAAGAPPPTSLPLIVLGHPGLMGAQGAEAAKAAMSRPGSVFIPVSTPGIGSTGHLFRADGGTVLPLRALYRDTLPMLADVLGDIGAALQTLQTLRTLRTLRTLQAPRPGVPA